MGITHRWIGTVSGSQQVKLRSGKYRPTKVFGSPRGKLKKWCFRLGISSLKGQGLFMFCKGHIHWKILKSMENFCRGTKAKTRGNTSHGLRIITGLVFLAHNNFWQKNRAKLEVVLDKLRSEVYDPTAVFTRQCIPGVRFGSPNQQLFPFNWQLVKH